eukprot:1055045_1
MEWHRILNISFVVFLLLLVYPLFVVSMTKLIQSRQRRYFVKRRASLVFAQFACIAMSNVLQLVLILNHLFTLISPLVVSVLSSLDICLVLWTGFLFSLRVYIINYDYQIQKEAINQQWKQSLVAYADRNIHFFSSHKATYGSIQWIMHRFGTAFCIVCSLLFILEFVFQISMMTKYLVFCLLFVFEMTGIGVIWIKFPYFNDKLFIRMELKECIQYGLSILILATLLIVSAQNTPNGVTLLMRWVQVLFLNGLTYISVIRVIKRNEKHEQMQSQLQLQQSTPLTLSSKLSSPSYTPSSPASVTKYAMFEIISLKAGFEAFINFLVQEWSSEHLIFLTEFMQIKQSLSDKLEEVDCKLNIDIPFTSSKYASPLDEWCRGEAETDCAHLMTVIDKLYKKYIAECAPYEINISWNARLALCALLDERYIAQPRLITKKRSRTFSRTGSRSITLPNFLRRDSREATHHHHRVHNTQSAKDGQSVEDTILNKNQKILKERSDFKACITIILPLLEQCCFEVIPLLLTSFNRFKLTADYVAVCQIIDNQSRKKRSSLSKLGIKDSGARNSSFSFSALRKAVQSASFSQLTMPKILGLSSQSSMDGKEVHFRDGSQNNNDNPLSQEEESDHFEDPCQFG